jgi:dihydroorotase
MSPLSQRPLSSAANPTYSAPPFSLCLQHATVHTPNGPLQLDIGVAEGRIVALAPSLATHPSLTPSTQCLNLKGLHVLPGVIDSQVHFREPGLEHKEDLATGTTAAVLGGVCTVFEMPNTSPSTTTQAAFEEKMRRAQGRCHSNYAFFIGAAAENVEQLPQLERLPGCSGVKLFMGASTGNLLVDDDPTILRVLQHGKRRVAIHAEDNARLQERKPLLDSGELGELHPRLHPLWRDDQSALKATQRVVSLAQQAQRPLHVLHITTAEEISFLAKNKATATVEVTPQHLFLSAPHCYDTLGSLAQMNPPIRGENHQAALWWGLEHGVVDVVGSDHAPHTLEEKAKPYPNSPAGMPGVQTLLPLLLHAHVQGRLSLQRLVDLTSAGPARIYGCPTKGRIALGFDADFTVVDLQGSHTLEREAMASRCGWSPFEGWQLQGRVCHTVVGGHVAMAEGALNTAPPQGQPVRFV